MEDDSEERKAAKAKDLEERLDFPSVPNCACAALKFVLYTSSHYSSLQSGSRDGRTKKAPTGDGPSGKSESWFADARE